MTAGFSAKGRKICGQFEGLNRATKVCDQSCKTVARRNIEGVNSFLEATGMDSARLKGVRNNQ
jgi:hypothetical protein